MGLLDNWFNKKITQYIENNIGKDVDPSSIFISDKQFDMLENRVWYTATKACEIEQFYKRNVPYGMTVQDKGFYRAVGGKMPRIHTGVPKLITNTIVNLVFSEEPDIEVDTGNKKTSATLNEELSKVLDENGGEQFLKDLAAQVSYSGASAVKFVLDKNVSDFIIFQAYPKEYFEITKKYGRITEIIFKDYYENDNKLYVLKSYYGIGYIKYKLFKDETEVPLTDLVETAELEDMEFYGADKKPLKQLMAAYIENSTGDSDYASNTGLFESLDEIASTELYIVRSTKPKRGVPTGLCQLDLETGKSIVPDDWDVDTTILEVEDPEKKIQNMNSLTFTSPTLTSYEELYKRIFKQILSNIGISPNSVSVEDSSGANASAEALNIREHASLRKRATLILCYSKFLKELAKLILMYNHSTWDENRCFMDDFSQYEFTVDFSEYNNPTFDSMVKVLSEALNAKLISQREAIKELYGDDMSEEEQEAMIQEINKNETLKNENELNNTLGNRSEDESQSSLEEDTENLKERKD